MTFSVTNALPERFWSKVEITDTCWVWTGHRAKNGYGKFRFDHEARLAHRVSYESLVGKVPNGLELDHLCRNRACVNPAHLEPVTRAENLRRGETRNVLAEKNRSKTHCPAGHPYSGDNLLTWPGWRQCRECVRTHSREYQRRRRSAA